MKQAYTLPSRMSVLLLACASAIHAHTWVEQLTVIASNGTFVGTPGYPRGLVDRIAGVNPSIENQYQLPPDGRPTGNAILPTDLMCRSTQVIGNQTTGNPALIASPGDQIALRYQENGHVTQPQLPAGRPEGSGTVFVYGTENPSNNDTYLGIHRVWNTAGTGGDGRGTLLATRYFDDGQCYQDNTSPISQARQKTFAHTPDALMNVDLWCQTDVQIPTTASGNYTLYWVWEWPLLDSTGKVTTNESYTSCMDVVLTSSGGNSKAEAVNFATGQSLNYAAIADQMSSQYLVDPTAPVQTFSNGPTPIFTGSVATATSAAVQTSSADSPQSSSAVGGFITVTVTAMAAAETETVTVTHTINGGDSSQAPRQASSTSQVPIATYSPVSTNQPSSASSASTTAATVDQSSGSSPLIVPFLSPSSEVANPPAQISTAVSQSPRPTPTIEEITSAAATSDCPDMTPTTNSAPISSAVPYTNGKRHVRDFTVKERDVRL